jgi:hypothetical protein
VLKKGMSKKDKMMDQISRGIKKKLNQYGVEVEEDTALDALN